MPSKKKQTADVLALYVCSLLTTTHEDSDNMRVIKKNLERLLFLKFRVCRAKHKNNEVQAIFCYNARMHSMFKLALAAALRVIAVLVALYIEMSEDAKVTCRITVFVCVDTPPGPTTQFVLLHNSRPALGSTPPSTFNTIVEVFVTGTDHEIR